VSSPTVKVVLSDGAYQYFVAAEFLAMQDLHRGGLSIAFDLNARECGRRARHNVSYKPEFDYGEAFIFEPILQFVFFAVVRDIRKNQITHTSLQKLNFCFFGTTALSGTAMLVGSTALYFAGYYNSMTSR
jgi:hypothetical protein